MAKDYFNEHGVAFEDYNVAMDREKAMEMMQKTGQSGVPVIVVGDDIVVGFNQPLLAQMLGIK
jgi:glutaredoxin